MQLEHVRMTFWRIRTVQTRAIAGQLLLVKKIYVWARDGLPEDMRHGLVDLEGVSTPIPRRVPCPC